MFFLFLQGYQHSDLSREQAHTATDREPRAENRTSKALPGRPSTAGVGRPVCPGPLLGHPIS